MGIPDWVTLAAVIVALGLGVSSLIQTHLLQKRERKERLLNEIIEWAEDINNASLTPDISLGIEQLKTREINVIMRYGNSLSKAISIGTIATVSFRKELSEHVAEVINTLQRFMCIKQLKVQGIMPTKEGFPETAIQEIEKERAEGKTIDELWYEHAKKLADSVRNLLIKANQIKSKDIA